MTINFLSSAISESLSFTLLHSLWQGLLILLLVRFALAFIPSRRSAARYLVVTSGLFVFVIGILVTFITVVPESRTAGIDVSQSISFTKFVSQASGSSTWIDAMDEFITQHASMILSIWLAGTTLFLVRVTASWVYVNTITSRSVALQDEWADLLCELANKIELKRTIKLIESRVVNSPVVIGFIKPMIVIPIGMTTGLTSEQVESIFIHELVHIKRHDYLINILQSLIEAVFFFNPFVWILSATIRKEREHCCDDAVVSYGANTKAYVTALASLEETRLQNNGFVLSIAGNKNELLNRIKRLMEKSVQNYSLRERIVPIVLLVVGFICASWFTIQKGNGPDHEMQNDKIVASDTNKKKKDKLTTSEEQAEVYHFEESSAGDVLPPGIADFENGFSDIPEINIPEFNFEVPEFNLELPEFGFDVPEFVVPEFDHQSLLTPDLHLFMNEFDTIPKIGHRDWNAFEEEFRKKFQERFKDFYNKNEKEIEKMLNEMKGLDAKLSKLDPERLAQLEKLHEHSLLRDQEHHLRIQEKMLREQDSKLRELENDMRRFHSENHEHMMELEKNMKVFESKMKEFQNVLKEELVKDGYISKTESINRLEWSDHGAIEINGKKIKQSDEKKYRDLHKKYFPEMKGNFHYSE